MNDEESEGGLLKGIETNGCDADAVAEHFENMIGGVDLDGSPACYYMLGFVAGFKHARNVDSDFADLTIAGHK